MKSRVTAVLSAAVLAWAGAAAADVPRSTAPAAAPAKVAATQAALRELWIGHIDAVRNVVAALVAKDAAAADSAEKGVVANARQIAGAIKPFYGKAAGEKLFGLLAGHYSAVKSHAAASIAADAAGAGKAVDELTANARQIAAFLSGANPFLPEATLNGLLSTHGGHHVQQNQQLAKGDLTAEAATREAMRKHMYVIADALGAALAQQFPGKFQAAK